MNDRSIDQHTSFMKQALELSAQSKNRYRQVGAVITNGIGASNSYFSHVEARETAHHAEAHAICQSAAKGIPTEGEEIYVTLSPCIDCAKLIIQAGIKTVYFYDLDPEQKLSLKLMFDQGVTLIGPVRVDAPKGRDGSAAPG